MQGIAPSGSHAPCVGGHYENLDNVQIDTRQQNLAAVWPTDFILLPPPIRVNFIADLRLRFTWVVDVSPVEGPDICPPDDLIALIVRYTGRQYE